MACRVASPPEYEISQPPPPVMLVRQEGQGHHQSPDSQLCSAIWEQKNPSTFVFSFAFPSFPLWAVFSEDFFFSASLEDSPSSSLTDTVELSEIVRTLGISGTWD